MVDSGMGPIPVEYALPLQILFVIIQIWTFFWKGLALWRSARSSQKYWFVAFIFLFPLNDLGLVELIYLFRFAKDKLTIKEIKTWREVIAKAVKRGK